MSTHDPALLQVAATIVAARIQARSNKPPQPGNYAPGLVDELVSTYEEVEQAAKLIGAKAAQKSVDTFAKLGGLTD